MSKEPFKKPFPAKDRWNEGGKNAGSFKYGTPDFVQPFNDDPVDKSPTDMTRGKNIVRDSPFFPRPKK
jgi:hypothetical protein